MRIQLRSTLFPFAALALAACAGEAASPLSPDAVEPRLAAGPPVCVEFNVPPLNAVLGAPAGHAPGTVVFVENGIRVSVHPFLHPWGASSYGQAQIVASPLATFGAGKVASVSNLNLGFDFTALSFVPAQVTFEWLDWAGHENLGVNGSPLFVGELDSPPPAIAGIPVASAWFAVPPGADQGTLTLGGGVKRVLVGGQQFHLDRVCAHP